MLKPGVNGRRKYEIGGSKLFDAPQALKLGGVHQFDFERGDLDISVDGIADQFPFAHARALGSHIGMAIQSISHTFYDFEIERVNSPDEIHLVKVLSVDGRRFTYELRAELTEEAVIYIKDLIDSVVFSDMVIEKTAEGFAATETKAKLKKHS
jgi:hypothetical protein